MADLIEIDGSYYDRQPTGGSAVCDGCAFLGQGVNGSYCCRLPNRPGLGDVCHNGREMCIMVAVDPLYNELLKVKEHSELNKENRDKQKE